MAVHLNVNDIWSNEEFIDAIGCATPDEKEEMIHQALRKQEFLYGFINNLIDQIDNLRRDREEVDKELKRMGEYIRALDEFIDENSLRKEFNDQMECGS